jgi:hypothetical protein
MNGRGAAMRWASRARRKIRKVTTAITAANGIVQRKSTRSGRAKAGRFSGLSEMSLVLSPVNDPIPIETSDPIPAARGRGRSRRWPRAARRGGRPAIGRWQRPPPDRRRRAPGGTTTRGGLVEAEILGDVGEHPLLDVEDELQEAPRRQGGDHPHNGREHEHGHERPAAQGRLGIGGTWRRGHVDLAQLVRPEGLVGQAPRGSRGAHRIAIGFRGEPVPPTTRSGDPANRNSQRRSRSQAATRSSNWR